MQYREEIEYIDGLKIINRIPIYTPEEEKQVMQDILRKLYRLFRNKEE